MNEAATEAAGSIARGGAETAASGVGAVPPPSMEHPRTQQFGRPCFPDGAPEGSSKALEEEHRTSTKAPEPAAWAPKIMPVSVAWTTIR